MLTFKLEGKLCQVEGPYQEQKALSSSLSFFNKAAVHTWEYKSGSWDGYVHLYDEDNQAFLGGMWKYAKSRVEELGVEVTVEDNRVFPEIPTEVDPQILPGIDLRPYQINAVKKSLLKKGGIIQVPTAGGKTIIAAVLLKILNRPALFLVEKRRLLRQTVRRFKKYGLQDVGKVGDNEFEPGFITVATVQTLNSRLKRGDDEVRDLLQSCEVLILDECHHASANSWQYAVMSTEAPFRFGLSGTPFRTRQLDRFEDFLLMGICGEPCYILTTQYLIQHGYIARPTIYMLPVSCPGIKSSTWAQVEKLGLVENSIRNGLAVKVTKKFVENDLRTVVMVKMIAHGLEMLKRLEAEGISAVFLCGDDVVYRQNRGEVIEDLDITTEDDDSETIQDFVERKFQVLIVSTILDEGIDVPEIEALVILSGGKSLIKTIQRLGRVLRKKLEEFRIPVVDFLDQHHNFLRKHADFRAKQYELEGHKVLGISQFLEDWK